MKEVEEQLILFETAKLAKKKGFNWKCLSYYNGFNLYSYTTKDHNNETIGDTPMHIRNASYYSAPTQSLLQKWLREVHDIDITIALVATGYGFYIHKNRNYTNKGESYGVSGNTYEKALEKGLQKALKLI